MPTHFRHEFGVKHDLCGTGRTICLIDRLQDRFAELEILLVGRDVNAKELRRLNKSVDTDGQILLVH